MPILFHFTVLVAFSNLATSADDHQKNTNFLTDDSVHVFLKGVISPTEKTFTLPVGVAIDNQNHVYVCDSSKNKFHIFGHQGKRIKSVNMFFHPYNVAVNASGNIFILNLNHAIQEFDDKGRLKRTIGQGNAITIDATGNLLYGKTDAQGGVIGVYNPNKEQEEKAIILKNKKGKAFAGLEILKLARTSRDDIVVLDKSWNLYLFDKKGSLLKRKKLEKPLSGSFRVDRHDNIFVCRAGRNGSVFSVLDPNFDDVYHMELLDKICFDFALDKQGNILTADPINNLLLSIDLKKNSKTPLLWKKYPFQNMMKELLEGGYSSSLILQALEGKITYHPLSTSRGPNPQEIEVIVQSLKHIVFEKEITLEAIKKHKQDNFDNFDDFDDLHVKNHYKILYGVLEKLLEDDNFSPKTQKLSPDKTLNEDDMELTAKILYFVNKVKKLKN